MSLTLVEDARISIESAKAQALVRLVTEMGLLRTLALNTYCFKTDWPNEFWVFVISLELDEALHLYAALKRMTSFFWTTRFDFLRLFERKSRALVESRFTDWKTSCQWNRSLLDDVVRNKCVPAYFLLFLLVDEFIPGTDSHFLILLSNHVEMEANGFLSSRKPDVFNWEDEVFTRKMARIAKDVFLTTKGRLACSLWATRALLLALTTFFSSLIDAWLLGAIFNCLAFANYLFLFNRQLSVALLVPCKIRIRAKSFFVQLVVESEAIKVNSVSIAVG